MENKKRAIDVSENGFTENRSNASSKKLYLSPRLQDHGKFGEKILGLGNGTADIGIFGSIASPP